MQDEIKFCPFLSICQDELVECLPGCMMALVNPDSGSWSCSIPSAAMEIRHYRWEEHGPGWELYTEDDEDMERQEPLTAEPEQDPEAGR